MTQDQWSGQYIYKGQANFNVYRHNYTSVTLFISSTPEFMKPMDQSIIDEIVGIAQKHKLSVTNEPHEHKQRIPDQLYVAPEKNAMCLNGVGKNVQAALTEIAALLGKQEEREGMKGLVKHLFDDDIIQARRREDQAANRFSVGKAFASTVAIVTSLHQIGQEGTAADSFVRRLTFDALVGIRGGGRDNAA